MSTQVVTLMRDFRLPPRSKWYLRFSGMSCSVDRLLVYWRFGTTYWPYFQGQSNPRRKELALLDLWIWDR